MNKINTKFKVLKMTLIAVMLIKSFMTLTFFMVERIMMIVMISIQTLLGEIHYGD